MIIIGDDGGDGGGGDGCGTVKERKGLALVRVEDRLQ